MTHPTPPPGASRILRSAAIAAGIIVLAGAYVAVVGPPALPDGADARADGLPPSDPTAPGSGAQTLDDDVATGPLEPTAGIGDAPHVTLRWPVEPFDEPHPIRGTFGEPRGIFGAGFDNATGPGQARRAAKLDPVNTPGARSLHVGVDIMAKDNAPVYAMSDGIARVGGSGQDEWVEVGDYRYIHIAPTVTDGQRIRAYQTQIGTIKPGDGHVHVTRYWRGRPVNPLAFGGFVGWADDAPPQLGRLRVFARNGQEISKHRLKGDVAIFVRAEDRQSQGGQESGIYLMSYRIINRWGATVSGPHTVFELKHIPRRRDAQRLYLTASTRHTSMTNFSYRLTLREPDGMLDSARLRPGRYTLEVTAMDVAGNATQRTYPLRNVPQGRWANS